MEHTPDPPLPRRTRRTPAQWARILAESADGAETSEQMARRLNCAVSTVEKYRQLSTLPSGPSSAPEGRGFVEVRSAPELSRDTLSLQTASGVRVTFHTLPPPDYLAAVLGMGS